MTRIVLGHGAGGQLTAELLDTVFLPALDMGPRTALGDSAWVGRGLAVTTDAFVVDPPEFPGGDIGQLALFGTINDLAVVGAKPVAVSAAFILEEGVRLELVRRVARSMGEAARAAGVVVVAGDTKVVGRRQCHRLYVVTAGFGRAQGPRPRARPSPGDAVLVSGPVGDHGAAVAWVRLGMPGPGPRSDCAPVYRAVAALRAACPGVGPLRDPTRGGLATALIELAEASATGMELDEASIPVAEPTRAAAEVLGLDPLYLACEGRVVCVCPRHRAGAALAALCSQHPQAAVVGQVTREAGRVVLRTRAGGRRLLAREGEGQLPRIC